ncbi:hypothetical protein CR513_08947, partial [Mucuna pruriens]
MDVTLGGLKQSYGANFTKRNLEVTFDLGLVVTGYGIPEPEANPEVELNIDIIFPSTLVLVQLRDLVIVKHQHFLPREYGAHRVAALLVLPEGVHMRYHLGITEPRSLVECYCLYFVIVYAKLLVGVACGEVEDHVVVKAVVVGVVGFRYVELEGAGLNHQPEYQDCEANQIFPRGSNSSFFRGDGGSVVAPPGEWRNRNSHRSNGVAYRPCLELINRTKKL